MKASNNQGDPSRTFVPLWQISATKAQRCAKGFSVETTNYEKYINTSFNSSHPPKLQSHAPHRHEKPVWR
jgi:hypothetical protein